MNTIQNQFLGFIHTPPLFQELHGIKQFEFEKHTLQDIHFSDTSIRQNLPLGKRVEQFFEIYINASKEYQLVKKNIQIIKNKHTFGELDFIIYDTKKETYFHIEQIYKFYLYDDTIQPEIERYIGPNKNDTLAKKMLKLTKKQLPLLYTEETKEYLQDIKSATIEQRVCFKGNIYLPWNLVQKDIPLLNTACIRGFYINTKEFQSQKRFRSFDYFVPEKFDWVSECESNEIWYSFEEVIDTIHLFLDAQKSPLIWSKNRQNNTTQSFFITWW